MTAILTEMISLLTGGIKGMATGIGEGLQELVTKVFTTGTGETLALSTFGAVVCIFGGIALAVGLSKFIVKWVGSLGSRK